MNSATTARWTALAAFSALPFALVGSFAGIPWPTTNPFTRVAASSDGPRDAVPLPPAPQLQLVKPLTAEQAVAANEALPFARNGLERAYSFGMGETLSDPLAYKAALECLTAAVYYEAASEGERGQRAVAQVVLNRVRHPAFPARVCEVVYQGSERQTGCQFTFTCDGSLARRPSRAGWDRARAIAADALAGVVEPSVGMATHYHANWVVPYWAPELDKIAAVGAHIFYRWPGFWGRRQAFSQRYTGEVLPESADATGAGLPSDPLVENPLQRVQSQANAAGLPGPAALLPAEDERARELLRDAASGGLIADERQFRLARDGETAPLP